MSDILSLSLLALSMLHLEDFLPAFGAQWIPFRTTNGCLGAIFDLELAEKRFSDVL